VWLDKKIGGISLAKTIVKVNYRLHSQEQYMTDIKLNFDLSIQSNNPFTAMLSHKYSQIFRKNTGRVLRNKPLSFHCKNLKMLPTRELQPEETPRTEYVTLKIF
jgi:hypothetical protein